MGRLSITLLVMLTCQAVSAQPEFSKPHGLYDVEQLSVSITPQSESVEVRFTTDGSDPTAQSTLYTAPLTFSETTILRAVEVKDGVVCSPSATATYLFMSSVLSQSATPDGYPSTWGQYATISGTAIADYEMDPDMTNDPVLRPKIMEGLRSLPVLSLVTDRDNLFSHENDEEHGGIYIFTGPPVGDPTGHGWTRPGSAELFGGEQEHDLSVNCGLRLHGGHGRLAEKNPKHSFRLVFKKEYGPGKLVYPLFGFDEPLEFNQLVVRCHFGNSWQHWDGGNRNKAQYTRDVWARRMQRKIGHTSVNALYVNLFLNGMYWGIYNIAPRVDDLFGKQQLGGKKEDIDVIKIEEDGGNHIEATEGTLDAWQLTTALADIVGGKQASSSVKGIPQGITALEAYETLKDSLLDIGNFIDYMLINQYAGNTDWDHHNWYALRRHGADSQGFRFLCWDTEIIFENVYENLSSGSRNNGALSKMFRNLLHNNEFAYHYFNRAKKLLNDEGLLGEPSVVAVWDSLYNTISSALYAEAARWGDYRRDVHPYSSRGDLYTVDGTYKSERRRLLNDYFPLRTDIVRDYIVSYLNIDDYEVPANWVKLDPDMFCQWDGNSIDSKPTGERVSADWNIGVDVGSGGVVAGFVGVEHDRYADISQYESMVIRGAGQGLRILANRLVAHGEWKQIVVSLDSYDPYWNYELGAVVVPLEQLRTMPTTSDNDRVDSFVHLHALKVDWGKTLNVKGVYLVPNTSSDLSSHPASVIQKPTSIYNLQGMRLSTGNLSDEHLPKGIYIVNGKKVLVR